MVRFLRRFMWTLVILLAIGAPAYYMLALHSPRVGDVADFPLDIAQIRELANSMPGYKPGEIRFENVAAFAFAEAMVVAGDPWKKTPIPVYSYQLIYPDQTVIIDAALDKSLATPEAMVPMFDAAAYQRMSAALEKAALIVITHEHADHIGGIVKHPRLKALFPALRLTDAQLAHPDRMMQAKPAAGTFDGYQALRYQGVLALAPGVVLIEAPGHTPGSQMVYVQLADGRELLFLGDVSWRMRNVDVLRERPLFMTLMIKEDRHAVLGQFKTLHRLMETEPGIKLVPGHDGAAVQALVDAGFMQAGFTP
ncbi:MAG: MBL fold metallo-hydrolase [Nevskiales bacterium]